jgi:hypothetical protein
MRCKAWVEQNFFKYSESKRYHPVEPDVVEYDKDSKPQYDLILGTDHERVWYHLKL